MIMQYICCLQLLQLAIVSPLTLIANEADLYMVAKKNNYQKCVVVLNL